LTKQEEIQRGIYRGYVEGREMERQKGALDGRKKTSEGLQFWKGKDPNSKEAFRDTLEGDRKKTET